MDVCFFGLALLLQRSGYDKIAFFMRLMALKTVFLREDFPVMVEKSRFTGKNPI